jgi:hypothetical protein
MTQANDNALFNNKMCSFEPNFYLENQVFLYGKVVVDDTLVNAKVSDDRSASYNGRLSG